MICDTRVEFLRETRGTANALGEAKSTWLSYCVAMMAKAMVAKAVAEDAGGVASEFSIVVVGRYSAKLASITPSDRAKIGDVTYMVDGLPEVTRATVTLRLKRMGRSDA